MGRGGETPRTLTGLVAQRLRRDIITNELKPGEHLSMTKLAQRYDVGFSPIREALFQIASEGLIHVHSHRGFKVAEINTAEMLDISQLRAELEAQGLRRSIENATDVWTEQVKQASDALMSVHAALNSSRASIPKDAAENWESRHRELHYALCSNCGSPWLLHFIDVLYDHLERYRRYFWDYRERANGADDEHEGIVRAALDRNVELAISRLRSHFRTQAELSLSAAASSRKAAARGGS